MGRRKKGGRKEGMRKGREGGERREDEMGEMEGRGKRGRQRIMYRLDVHVMYANTMTYHQAVSIFNLLVLLMKICHRLPGLVATKAGSTVHGPNHRWEGSV